jgi:hypothetical protein
MKPLVTALTVLATLGVFTIGDATVGERKNPEFINQFGEVIIKAKSHSVAF